MSQEVLWGQFRLLGEADDGRMAVMLGQPVDQESPDWWRLVVGFLQLPKVEVSKVIQHNPKTDKVGTVWRIKGPVGTLSNWRGDVSPAEAVDEVPQIIQAAYEPSPSGYEPLDRVFVIKQCATVQNSLVAIGQPANKDSWPWVVDRLIRLGKAQEVAKVYTYVEDIPALVSIWRVIIPLPGLGVLGVPRANPSKSMDGQEEVGEEGEEKGTGEDVGEDQETEPPLQSPPQPPPSPTSKPGLRRRRRKARLTREQETALRRWRARTPATPTVLSEAERAVLARNLKEYQEKVASAPREIVNGEVRIKRFPLFCPYTAALGRLTIVEGVRSDMTVRGFNEPSGKGIVLDLESGPPPVRKG